MMMTSKVLRYASRLCQSVVLSWCYVVMVMSYFKSTVSCTLVQLTYEDQER